MRRLVIIIVAVLFANCTSSNYQIAVLKNKKLCFDELPLKVKEYLSNPPDTIDDSYKGLVLIDLTDSAIFSLETIETWIGPWVAYMKLKDKQKNISYRINQDTPDPFIIFNKRLYIPDRYNILVGGSAYEAVYTEYQLK